MGRNGDKSSKVCFVLISIIIVLFGVAVVSVFVVISVCHGKQASLYEHLAQSVHNKRDQSENWH